VRVRRQGTDPSDAGNERRWTSGAESEWYTPGTTEQIRKVHIRFHERKEERCRAEKESSHPSSYSHFSHATQ